MFGYIPWNVWLHFPECLATFPGIFGYIPRNVWRHSWEYNIPLFPVFPVPVFLVLYIALFASGSYSNINFLFSL